MRTLNLYIAAIVSLAGVGHAVAAPIPGFEANYAANFAACTLPDGTLAACETAINAHSAALVNGGFDLVTANAAFTALRAEVFAANAADKDFRGLVDALFEQLLPNSGAIGPVGANALSPAISGFSTSPN
jgi:hypothetical protein